MKTITIKGIPDPLYRQIKRRAAEHRRSINSEAIICLEQSVAASRIDPEVLLADIDAIHKRLNLPPLTEDFLRKAKNWGRP